MAPVGLNEVLTTVGLGHPLQCFSRYAMNKDLGYMIEHATPELLAFGMHEPTGYLPTLPAGIEYSTQRDLWRLPWWIFDELALIPTPRSVAAVGNVHALVLAHIGQARQQDPGLLAWLSDFSQAAPRDAQ